MPISNYAPLDEALKRLSGYDIELKNGNSNHAPMVAEALCAMGRPEAVMPWIARYRDRLLPLRPPGARSHIGSRGSALGKHVRCADWAEFFAQELQRAPWREVLDRWVARLAPGFSSAATHGVIRVGHAVRSLSVAEPACRIRELGDAFASWAATYRELPSRDSAGGQPMAPRQAVEQAPVIAPQRRRNLGNITASLAMLDEFPEFAPVIGTLDVHGDIEPLLAELTDLFARLYLTNARDTLTTIVFIHGVTSLAALGSIMPHVGETTARLALRYAWQSGCALYACFGSAAIARESPSGPDDATTLIDRAVANGDEHVIKFTEACLRRHSLAPSPAYCAAVDHVVGALRGC
ncbi:MAG: DUF4243 domain-containing protein [Alphaproteobacteria bacterium]|nr:DUF4243 domain-containing protein [Alphaproteobacteria bacterium]